MAAGVANLKTVALAPPTTATEAVRRACWFDRTDTARRPLSQDAVRKRNWRQEGVGGSDVCA